MPTVFGSHEDTEAMYGIGMDAAGTDTLDFGFGRDDGTVRWSDAGIDAETARERDLTRRGLATSLLNDDPYMASPDTTRLESKGHNSKRVHENGVDADLFEPLFDPLAKPEDGDAPLKKKRKPIAPMPKLDADVLSSDKGFGYIRHQATKLRFKGKGHEAEDLARLIQFYQIWGHQLFPRLKFDAFVERVEKLCRSRRLNIQADAWRDEHFRTEKAKRDGLNAENAVTNEDWDDLIAKELEGLDPQDDEMIQDLEGEIISQRSNLFDDDMSDVEPSQSAKSRRILDSDEEDTPRTTIPEEDEFDFLERAINAAASTQ